MKLVQYLPSLKIEVPDTSNLEKIPQDWFFKTIVVSIIKRDSGYSIKTIEFYYDLNFGEAYPAIKENEWWASGGIGVYYALIE